MFLIIQFVCVDNLIFYGKLINLFVCIINNGEMLEVSFGSVIIDNIDGVNYLIEILWIFICDSSFCDDVLIFMLSYLGMVMFYFVNVLIINVFELGIEFQQNGMVFFFGMLLIIDELLFFILKVVLVKQSGKEFVEGDFEVFVMLQVDY